MEKSGLLRRLGITRKTSENETHGIQASPQSSTIDSSRRIEAVEKETGISSDRGIQELEANRKLNAFEKAHKWDPNLDTDQLDEIDDAVNARDPNAEGRLYDEIFENSPYPEVCLFMHDSTEFDTLPINNVLCKTKYLQVRAAVRNYDEELPANTIRAWVLGLLLTTIASGLNALFSLRSPTLTISSFVVQLVAYPLGFGWAKVIPSRTFETVGVQWSLNPGPFNMKEHGLIVIMANAAIGNGVGYFTDTIVAQRGFYGQDFGWGFDIMLAFTTQVSTVHQSCLSFLS